eukprot:m.343349 g.343349  ORF g.343349 m.343349 type:complete len:972 (+) comp22716_c0_seq1:109-3024(+)
MLFKIVAVLAACICNNYATKLTRVHVIPHSHEDPGWLETEDQYYRNDSRQIITNVVKSLRQNSSRVFHYVEMVYLRRWWLEQNTTTQDAVKQLVKNKQLMFLTGGLCMNDEATTHQTAIIDQMTWGHRFLNNTFGADALPTVGWQIDPFGHAAGYTTLTAEMGFEAFIGQKTDYQEFDARNKSKQLEFNWYTDYENKPNTTVFGHLMWDNTKGYSYVLPNIIDDPTNPLYNVKKYAESVAESVYQRVASYSHASDILFPYGTDFWFQDAPVPFENMEKIMKYINNRPQVFGLELVYSSPKAYFDAVRKDNSGQSKFTNYKGDFFPTSFGPHYIRSGYYTSRPASKGTDRVVWAEGHSAKLLQFLLSAQAAKIPEASSLYKHLEVGIAAVEASVGVHQHHDAMPGTDLEFVAENYAQMMVSAGATVTKAMADAAIAMSSVEDESNPSGASGSTCEAANVSICTATGPLAHNESVSMVLFNPLASMRTEVIEIPVPVSGVIAKDSSGKLLQSEVHHSIMADPVQGSPYTLFILLENMNALGMKMIHLIPASDSNFVHRYNASYEGNNDIELHVSSGASATVSGTTGDVVKIGAANVSSALNYYKPDMANNMSRGWTSSNPCSSAYAFRPQPGGPISYGMEEGETVMVSKGKLVAQSYVVINKASSVQFAVRVKATDPSVHLIVGAGPLETSNGVGQEMVMNLQTALNTNATWYTDSNGLQLMKRKLRVNATSDYIVYEPEAQNYYPSTSIAAIRDIDEKGDGLSLVYTSSRGVTSQKAGVLEVMVHRRLVDNGCRVDQGYQLDDAHRVVNTFLVQMGSNANLSSAYRLDSLRAENPISMFFKSGTHDKFSTFRNENQPQSLLPANVHLHTLRVLGEDLRCDPFDLQKCKANQEAQGTTAEVLLRLQHIYGVAEHASFSKPEVVDVMSFLAPFGTLVSMDEVSLTASKTLTDNIGFEVSIEPFQIKTFKCIVRF